MSVCSHLEEREIWRKKETRDKQTARTHRGEIRGLNEDNIEHYQTLACTGSTEHKHTDRREKDRQENKQSLPFECTLMRRLPLRDITTASRTAAGKRHKHYSWTTTWTWIKKRSLFLSSDWLYAFGVPQWLQWFMIFQINLLFTSNYLKKFTTWQMFANFASVWSQFYVGKSTV